KYICSKVVNERYAIHNYGLEFGNFKADLSLFIEDIEGHYYKKRELEKKARSVKHIDLIIHSILRDYNLSHDFAIYFIIRRWN
ncbi:2617_t:CDS:2, partial [Funneliformis geosporum]